MKERKRRRKKSVCKKKAASRLKKREVRKTHQNYRAHEDDVGEEVAGLREPRCFKLKLTGVRP